MHALKSLALIPLLACAVQARAESISSAMMSNLTVTLTDLDPEDGITPSITFNTASKYNATVGTEAMEVYSDAPSYSTRSLVLAANKFGPVSTSSVSDFATARASVQGDGTLGGTVLFASGRSSSVLGTTGIYSAGAHMLRDTTNSRSADAFRLSAHTRAIFSVDVDLFAHLANESFDTSPYRLAVAFSELMVLGTGVGDHLGVHFTFVDLKVEQNSDSAYRDNGQRLKTTSKVAYENVTADWLGGAVGVSASVHGESRSVRPPMPTPLPGSMLCLLSGLAFAGWRRSAERRVSKA